MTTKAELLRRIRLNCQECVGGPRAVEELMGHKAEDIAGCTVSGCAFYPFRLGTDPWPNEKRAEHMAKFNPQRTPSRTRRKNPGDETA